MVMFHRKRETERVRVCSEGWPEGWPEDLLAAGRLRRAFTGTSSCRVLRARHPKGRPA